MTEIYLLSPPQIENIEKFLEEFSKAAKTDLVALFQLRIKPTNNKQQILNIGHACQKICKNNNIPFILNDNIELAIELKADGIHLGENDANIEDIKKVRKILGKNFIIGISCYDNIAKAMQYDHLGVNYVSFGTFFKSSTKNSQGKPKIDIISQARKKIKAKICVIGGINIDNCQELIKEKPDYIAVISAIWKNNLAQQNTQELFNKIKGG